MKIAIIGAGLSGLSSAWYLSQIPSISITLFDPGPLGKNASGLAAGLLHPFFRPQAKLPLQAKEGLHATLELLEIASQILGRPVYRQTGMLRPALNEEQKIAFKICATHHPDTFWLEPETFQKKVPGIIKEPGLFIQTAYHVDTLNYLEGLWKGCEKNGVIWEKRKIENLRECDTFDQIIVATGAFLLPELSYLPIHPVKGQIVSLNWETALPIPINGPVYLLELYPNNLKNRDSELAKGPYCNMGSIEEVESRELSLKSETNFSTCLGINKGEKKETLLGATFEHGFSSAEPDLDTALSYLFPRVKAFFPSLLEKDLRSRVINCQAGVRGSAPQHRPLLQQCSPKIWYLGGMGSKGLLYHALYAKELCRRIIFS